MAATKVLRGAAAQEAYMLICAAEALKKQLAIQRLSGNPITNYQWTHLELWEARVKEFDGVTLEIEEVV